MTLDLMDRILGACMGYIAGLALALGIGIILWLVFDWLPMWLLSMVVPGAVIGWIRADLVARAMSA